MTASLQRTLGRQPGSRVLDGKLEIVRLIGEGGMGEVYEVIHRATGHRRALKTLRREFGDREDVIERFQREATVAARLGSAVVETYDAGALEDGCPYVLMELLQGLPLDAFVIAKRDDALVVRIVADAAKGLHLAHEAGIIHRDIKPENLFVGEAPEHRVKILDFGISKFLDSEPVSTMTIDGSMLGTPHYMSPEQAAGKVAEIGPATDVYSLGVVLYECLSGSRPIDGPTLPAIVIAIHSGAVRPLSQIRPDISPSLASIVERAMALDPSARFASMQEMARALEDCDCATSGRRHEGGGRAPAFSMVRAADVSPRDASVALPPLAVKPRWPVVAGVALCLLGGLVVALSLRGSEPTESALPMVEGLGDTVEAVAEPRREAARPLPLGAELPPLDSSDEAAGTSNPQRAEAPRVRTVLAEAAGSRREAAESPTTLTPASEIATVTPPPTPAVPPPAVPPPAQTETAPGELRELDRSNPYGN